MEVVIFVGIQATGKSTFYREQFFRTHIRINLDMLRTRHREKILFAACLDTKQPVVIDNTNPTRIDRARYIEPTKDFNFKVIGYYFQSRVEDALQRNAARPEAESIPEVGILATYKQLELPAFDEGFDELYYVSIDDGFNITRWQDE